MQDAKVRPQGAKVRTQGAKVRTEGWKGQDQQSQSFKLALTENDERFSDVLREDYEVRGDGEKGEGEGGVVWWRGVLWRQKSCQQ